MIKRFFLLNSNFVSSLRPIKHEVVERRVQNFGLSLDIFMSSTRNDVTPSSFPGPDITAYLQKILDTCDKAAVRLEIMVQLEKKVLHWVL